MEWVLEVVEVRRRPLLRGISFAAPAGAVTAVAGGTPEAAALLFRLALGMERPDRGAVLILGEDISRARERARERITRRLGVVFGGADFALFGAADAHENVAIAVRTADRRARRHADGIAAAALARVGLSRAADYYPGELPVEARRRLAFARALALRARLVVADVRDAPANELPQLVRWLREDRDAHGAAAVVLAADPVAIGPEVDKVVDLDRLVAATVAEAGEPSLTELLAQDPLIGARRLSGRWHEDHDVTCDGR